MNGGVVTMVSKRNNAVRSIVFSFGNMAEGDFIVDRRLYFINLIVMITNDLYCTADMQRILHWIIGLIKDRINNILSFLINLIC